MNAICKTTLPPSVGLCELTCPPTETITLQSVNVRYKTCGSGLTAGENILQHGLFNSLQQDAVIHMWSFPVWAELLH